MTYLGHNKFALDDYRSNSLGDDDVDSKGAELEEDSDSEPLIGKEEWEEDADGDNSEEDL